MKFIRSQLRLVFNMLIKINKLKCYDTEVLIQCYSLISKYFQCSCYLKINSFCIKNKKIKY